jgi:hypothetical protein
MLIIDTECFPNYWLFRARDFEERRDIVVELTEELTGLDNDSVMTIRKAMKNNLTVGFNSLSYDLPMITAAIMGWSNRDLKKLSDLIITSDKPSWMVCNDQRIKIPDWEHIDLINVAKGKASLKLYGARLGAKVIQDLPYPDDSELDPSQMDRVSEYCANDLELTHLLYQELSPQLQLRRDMSDRYGYDLLSKGDAQIADKLITGAMADALGKKPVPMKYPETYTFPYRIPKYIQFSNSELNKLLYRIYNHRFKLRDTGSAQLPEWMEKEPISLYGREYKMGIGGLHSMESGQTFYADDHNKIIDVDAASFYPYIIKNLGLAPRAFGNPFRPYYEKLISERIEAKRKGDKVKAETLKIVLNSSFGKFGSRFSAMYSPEMLIQVTITGQLTLLMLIERMGKDGFHAISANTDGVTFLVPEEDELMFNMMLDEFAMLTRFELERVHYQLLCARDVNNYFALKIDGSVKTKGLFADPGIEKNPDQTIVPMAVMVKVLHGIEIDTFVRNVDEIHPFLMVRTVREGGEWNDVYLGKVVRFYRSTLSSSCIRYVHNGNKVPKSDFCRPVMALPKVLPDDIDYDYYIREAEKLLNITGAMVWDGC